MKSPYSFIVEPLQGKRYTNTKSIGGIEFVVSTSEEDHKFSNREAVVVETPINYSGPISKGDILLVHHNVFKFYNDMKGRRQSGKSYFKDNLFFIDEGQFFLYKKDYDWITFDKYCFVKPIEKKESFLSKSGRYEPLTGEIVYPNDYLKSQGIKSGDTVIFQPDSEYEFYVDGQVLYRMYDSNITIKMS